MTENAKRFDRGKYPFFTEKRTKEALKDLMTKDEVILYCGAGVTIDRTGMGWSDLIRALEPTRSSDRPQMRPGETDKLFRALDHPQRVATVLKKYWRGSYRSSSDEEIGIANRLRTKLYKERAWQGGRLVSSVARYAIDFANRGKKVTIVTTNYDTYTEDSIIDELDEMRDKETDIPAFQVSAVGYAGFIKEIPASCEGAGTVHLIYLHGRVDVSEAPVGRLVIDEIDYAQTRRETVSLLEQLFRPEVGVLIIGASLTDSPLIEAFVRTLTGESSSSRYVIMPVRSTGVVNNTRREVVSLIVHLRARCRQLELNLLIPDFMVQIAQFFEELRFCLTLDSPDEYAEITYGKRLTRWSSRWAIKTAERNVLVRTHETLRELAFSLSERIMIDELRKEEQFKIELWVRWRPSATSRRLALWGSSMGILIDRDLLRTAPLAFSSGQASVECFTEGRPQHSDLNDIQPGRKSLKDAAYDTRWKSFLSVPVYLEGSDRQLMAGVITLASSLPKADSSIPADDINDMIEITDLMREVGREILDA
jgi:hypothetical protein